MRRSLWSAVAVAAALVAGLALIVPLASAADTSDTAAVPGSIWMQRNDPDPATYYLFNGDGTLLAVDPYHGYGVGVWQPAGERRISSALVFGDVDPNRFAEKPGVATVRSEASIDWTSRTMGIVTRATYEPADGTGASNDEGTSAATRLWLVPMPKGAIATTPPDPGWVPTTGPGYRDGRGTVTTEPYALPNHNVLHADGSWFSFNSYVGPGVGLWLPLSDTSAIATLWFSEYGPDQDPHVAQVTAEASVYGMASTGLTETSQGDPFSLEPAPGASPLPSPDALLWPSPGSAWLVRHEDAAPGLMIVYADGTVLHVDPVLGTGLGLWQPTARDTAAVRIIYDASYPNNRYVAIWGTADLRGEMTADEQAGTLTVTYDVTYDRGRKGDPSGTMTAERIGFQPTAE